HISATGPRPRLPGLGPGAAGGRRGGRPRRGRPRRGRPRRGRRARRGRVGLLGAGGLRGGGGLGGLASAGGTVVGAVETAALEGDADGAEDLAQLAAARGADGERVVLEGLDHLHVLSAPLADVLVGRHVCGAPPRWFTGRLAQGWHSRTLSANSTPS